MKPIFCACLLFLAASTHAQYYYKDVIGTQQSATLLKTYAAAGVTAVQVASYDADNTRTDAFSVAQTFSKAHARLQTITRSESGAVSVLTAYADGAGNIVRTTDSSAALFTETEYTYNVAGQLVSLKSASSDSAKKMNEIELHQWQYEAGLPTRMLRILNDIDTTIVSFNLDAGRVAEETSVRRGTPSGTVYYYYNAANQLTDIVRYSNKAKRLLPEYMFEYDTRGNVIQKITVPANSSAYLIWRYQYDASGLKIKEAIYDRYKTLNGKVEYTYTKE